MSAKDIILTSTKESILSGNNYLPVCEFDFAILKKSNKLNFFIGANNSGKSRFIRFMLSKDDYITIGDFDVFKDLTERYNKTLKILSNFIEAILNESNQIITYNIDNNIVKNRSTVLRHNYLVELKLSDIVDLKKELDSNSKKLLNIADYIPQHTKIFHEQLVQLQFEMHASIEIKNNTRIFIPTLRTAHSLFEDNKKIEKDIYLDTLNKNYSLLGFDIKIFTGIHLHREILNARNAKKDVRKSFERFEKFISKNFFNGKDVDIVAEFNKDENLKGNNHNEIISVHIDGEEDRYLYELGDGIQAIIILMYQIFMAEPDSMIFIDEPELHLHPGMQRLFLEQLCNNEDLKKKNLTYFITTHSNHFLDLTIEKDNVSIYSFSSQLQDNGEKKFIIKNINAGDNEVLQNLGVNNSSVFMANCSIWVEGISDRNYIKAFLKAYTDHLFEDNDSNLKSIKEDIDYAFFEYAGSNVDHYFFGDLESEEENEIIDDINAMALNNRILLLADSDNSKENSAKRARLDKLKEQKDGNFIPIIIEEIREIENLLTNEIWEEILIYFCNKKLVNKSKDEIITRIFNALKVINASEYENEYIGQFLSKVNRKVGKIGDINILNESIYERKPKLGTFVLKRELSELVLKADFEWDVFALNPKIVELTKSIYKFIINRA